MKDWQKRLPKWGRMYLLVYVLVFIVWNGWPYFDGVLPLTLHIAIINGSRLFVIFGLLIAIIAAFLQMSHRLYVFFLLLAIFMMCVGPFLLLAILVGEFSQDVVAQEAHGDQNYVLVYEQSLEGWHEYILYECDEIKHNCVALYGVPKVLDKGADKDKYPSLKHLHYLDINEELNEIYIFEHNMLRFIYNRVDDWNIVFNDDYTYISEYPKLLGNLFKEYSGFEYRLFVAHIPETNHVDLILYHCMLEDLPDCEIISFRYSIEIPPNLTKTEWENSELADISLVDAGEELHLRVDDELIYSYDGETGVCYVDGCWAP